MQTLHGSFLLAMAKLSPLTESEKVFVEALAGAFGGFAGAVVFYPLDTVKTRIQAAVENEKVRSRTWFDVFSSLVQKEGLAALFAGVGAKGVHSLTSSFLYFLTFSALRRRVEAQTGAKIGVGANLLIAALAGCCNVLITEPLDTLSTRQQVAGWADGAGIAANASSSSAFSKARSSEGTGKRNECKAHRDSNSLLDRASRGFRDWASLYSGVGASLLLTVNPAVQYTCFEQMRRRVISSLTTRAKRRGKPVKVVELSVGDAFVLGATSKAIATFITYPLVRAKVLAKGDKFAGVPLPEILLRVADAEGSVGLYKGLSAQLLKTVLASAFTLTVKEKSFRAAMLVVLLFNRVEF